MEETKPLVKPQKPDFGTLFKSLFSLTEFRVTIIMTFIPSVVFIFSCILVSLFYIKVWKVKDNLAGVFLATNCSQIFLVLVPGIIISKYGIKFSYLFSTSVILLTFLLLTLIQNIWLHVVLINFGFGFATIILWAALKAGITETTTLQNRSLGFSIFNSSYNFSTILLGLVYELVFYKNGINMTSFQVIFGVFIGLLALEIVLVLCFSKLEKNSSSSNSQIRINEILNQKRYWKTLAVIVFSAIPLGGAYFLGIVLPIYMDRELGSTTGYGLFFAGYSLMLGVFGIAFNFITNYLSLYDCIVLGGFITALGPLVFVVDSNYFAVAAYVIITAVGGSIIQPRIVDYNGFASVKGHEGFYYAISSIGYAFTAIFTGFVSGFLLENYCPDDGRRECWKMWSGLSGFCAFGVLLLVMFKPLIEVHRDHEEIDPYVFSRHLS